MAGAVGRDLEAIFEKAIDQLIKTTFQRAEFLNFRWPYQANVIKMLEMEREKNGFHVREAGILAIFPGKTQ